MRAVAGAVDGGGDGGGNAGGRLGVPGRLVGAVALGTVLNPLNSSMIAVALVTTQRHYGVGVATSTWLLSGFYLSAAVGQPLMGRLVDLFDPRRLFIAGLVLVLVSSVAAPYAPGFWWLILARAVQGLGSSVAFPAALVIFRAAALRDRPPAGALAVLGVAASSSTALGPVLGGALIALWDWRAIFLVNLPLTLTGIGTALIVLPTQHRPVRRSPVAVLREIDVPGMALFATVVTATLMLLLSIAKNPQIWLAPVILVAAILLVIRERRTATPFIDLRGMISNRVLPSVLIQQSAVNVVFYGIFFGLPIWLEAVRGLVPSEVGPLMLPLTIVGLLVTPLTARAIRKSGPRPVLIFGSLVALAGTFGIQLLGDTTPIVVLIAITVVMGIPDGLNNLGLQTALYAASPPERTGGSGGLFQTFRYLGAIVTGSLLGVVFDKDLSTSSLHHIGWVVTGSALVLVTLAVLLPRNLGRPRQAR